MRPIHGRFRDDTGYTLFEVLAVLVIVLVMVSLAAPSMTAYLARNRTRGALDRIATDIAYSRILAIRSGDRVVLEFTDPAVYTIEAESTGSVRRVSLAKDFAGVTITPPTSDSRLVFDSRGLLLTPGTGTLVARVGAAADSVILTAAGRVYRAY